MPMKKILIADDEENLRLLVRTTLEDPDYQIIEAADGAAALRLIREERARIDRGGARVDEWGRLLSGCRGNTSTAGSNPALPASLRQRAS